MPRPSIDCFLLGCHLPIARGFSRAIDEAEALGNQALQFFSHSPATWRMKPLSDEAVARFRRRRSTSSVSYVVVHTMYLINLAGPDAALYERSVDALIEEVRRARRLGADAVVTHLGSYRGGVCDAGIGRVAAAIQRLAASSAWEDGDGVRLLLENAAGAGTTAGASFEELGSVLDRVSADERFGVCLDTCHAFAAGYDLRTPHAVDRTLAALDRAIGLERLQAIHLNDSQFSLGSRRDRHAHIGRGEIGAEGLGALLRERRLRPLPVILETPKTLDGRPDADRINLAAARTLRAQEGSP